MVKTKYVDFGGARSCVVKELTAKQIRDILELWKKNEKRTEEIQNDLFGEFFQLFDLLRDCFQFSKEVEVDGLSVSEMELLFDTFKELHESVLKKIIAAANLMQQAKPILKKPL